jgi:predicted permease
MDIFGSFALVLAFVCAVYAFGGASILPSRRAVLVLSGAQPSAVASPLVQALTPHATLRKDHD